MNQIAQFTFEELSKVIPSFIRRADAEHRSFQDYRNFNLAQQQLVRNFASAHLGELTAELAESVCLVDYDHGILPFPNLRLISSSFISKIFLEDNTEL